MLISHEAANNPSLLNKTRFAHGTGGEPFYDFRLDDQTSAHKRLALGNGVEPENMLLSEPVLAAQEALDIEALFYRLSGNVS